MDKKQHLFLQELDGVIAQNSMLKHPFYQYWSQGKLPVEVIKQYAKQYYAQVKAFPVYVSAVHSHCEDITTRQMLLENLVEEEQGPDNHPELWLRFSDGMDVSREDVQSADLLPSTNESVNTLKRLTQNENYLEGLAALYAYESQIPEVALTKRQGLDTFYGINDERTVSFFSVHEQADVWHRQVERDIFEKNCLTDEIQHRVISAAEKGAQALLGFLDGVFKAYVKESTYVPC